MEITGRVVVLCLCASVSAVLVPLACAVDDRPPRLDNEVPNRGGKPVGSATSGGGPHNVCECAAANYDDTNTACQDCFHDTAGVDGACAMQASSCTSDDDCKALSGKLYACSVDAGAATCIADLLGSSEPGVPLYVDLLACACEACAAECTFSTSLACDAGNGSGGGGSGGGDAGDLDAADAAD